MAEKRMSGRLPATDFVLLISVAAIAGCTIAALLSARHWPLVGDSSLMRYVVFLIGKGRVPYAQIIDINLPGSYLLEAVAMRVFGNGAIGLRLYDGFLSAVICVCAVILSKDRIRARLCALAGGLLIVLVHLHDGLVQAGQRDYAILAIVLLAYVFLLRGPFAMRSGPWIFGFLAGCTLTIKPTMLLLALLPLYMLFLQRQDPRGAVKRSTVVLIAFLLPIAGMFCWLHSWHVIPDFLHSMELARRAHSGLAHKSVGFLLVHSVQPVALLLAFGMVLLAVGKSRPDDETKLLLFGALAGLVSFILQGKGFAYQRYPFFGVLIIVVFGLFAHEIGAHPLNRALATAALAFSCLWWGPRFALEVSGYESVQPFEDSLAHNLTALHAGPGDVQCLDTVGGCVNVLYNEHLVQSTGYLYDCYAYSGPADLRAAYRQSFLNAVELARPRYIVLTSQFCLDAQGRPDRLHQWPAMQEYLAQNYAVKASWLPTQAIHWWHQPEQPPGFQIFGRR